MSHVSQQLLQGRDIQLDIHNLIFLVSQIKGLDMSWGWAQEMTWDLGVEMS
jgi:hypothetical protein